MRHEFSLNNSLHVPEYRLHQFLTRSLCFNFLYMRRRTVAILYWCHSKFWVIVSNSWFIPCGDVSNESLLYSVVLDQKLLASFPVFHFVKNFGTYTAHIRLHSRSLSNLFTGARDNIIHMRKLLSSNLSIFANFFCRFLHKFQRFFAI